MRGYIRAAAVAAGLCLAASSVLAQPAGVTTADVKCESGTGKALSKFVGAKGKCAQKCFATARKTSGPYTGCFAPYADPTTNACIMDPVKGVEQKARNSIVKACTAQCPKCYAASDCSTGEPFVTNTENLVDLQGPNVYCDENGNNTPSKTDAKCEDGNAKALAKFVASKSKCYDKCNQNAFKGKNTVASCQPPASDPATHTCITTAETKTAATIDKLCFTAPATHPSCYDGSAFRPNSGAGWTSLVEGVVDSQVPVIACGSPSGAFLE
jgi:hypothetical protein